MILAAAVPFTAACGTGSALRGEAGHALVVFAADRTDDAEQAAARLREIGFGVDLEPEGPAVRTRSSAAVYLARRRPDRVAAVEAALEPLDVEILPFVQAGPPGNDVVIWLVAR